MGVAQKSEGLGEFVGIFLLGQRQHQDADGRAGRVRAGRGGVPIAAVRSLTFMEIGDALLDRVFRHADAGVAGGEERDHLSAADRRVRVFALRRVAPGFVGIVGLGSRDELDGLFQGVAEPGIVDRPIRFGQGQGCEAVVVHRRADIAGFLVLLFQDKIQAAMNRQAEGAGVRIVAVRQHADHRQSHHPRLAAVGRVRPIAFRGLRAVQEFESLDVNAVDLGGGQIDRFDKKFLRRGQRNHG